MPFGGNVGMISRKAHRKGDMKNGVMILALVFSGVASAVDPLIGTSGTGHAFPGPCRPFGLVQPSPETGNGSWKYCSGYCFDDPEIRWFAQTHLNGTGQASLGDVALMPVVESAVKRDETAALGHYAVSFAGGTKVEIAAGLRVARYRFTFPTGRPAQIRFDFRHGLYRQESYRRYLTTSCEVAQVSPRELRGQNTSAVWAPRTIGYVCRFNRDFASFADDVCTFADGGVIELAIALSAKSVEGAARNLAAEEGESFDAAVAATRRAWQEIFDRLPCASRDPATRQTHETALYRLCIQPNLISDDGEAPRYSTFSLWDTYRTAHPLYERLVPERVPDFVNSLLDHFRTYGYLPRWELWGRETNCMIGDPAVFVIVSAYRHGFRGFDVECAYEAVRTTLTTCRRRQNVGFYPPREERDIYDKYGYFPCDLVPSESVSRTLESAYADFCASEFARALGRADDAEFFERRSWGFTNLFDSATLCFRPKDSHGRWLADFEPARQSVHYTEGSPLQYSWFAPHRTAWLVAAMGGPEAFERRLDAFFEGTLEPGRPRGYGRDVTGLVGDYAHGNEPCHFVTDLYRFIGRPEKAVALERRIRAEFYRPAPDGLCGNDDCGQMSAWWLSRAIYDAAESDRAP